MCPNIDTLYKTVSICLLLERFSKGSAPLSFGILLRYWHLLFCFRSTIACSIIGLYNAHLFLFHEPKSDGKLLEGLVWILFVTAGEKLAVNVALNLIGKAIRSM